MIGIVKRSGIRKGFTPLEMKVSNSYSTGLESSHKCRKFLTGFTLVEVLVASMLLTAAMVPILRALTGAHTMDVKIERRMRSLTLADAKLEDIKGRSIYNYSSDFNDSGSYVEGLYVCKVVDTAVSGDLRTILLSVGYDENGNGQLDSSEIQVTLKTLLAQRWL